MVAASRRLPGRDCKVHGSHTTRLRHASIRSIHHPMNIHGTGPRSSQSITTITHLYPWYMWLIFRCLEIKRYGLISNKTACTLLHLRSQFPTKIWRPNAMRSFCRWCNSERAVVASQERVVRWDEMRRGMAVSFTCCLLAPFKLGICGHVSHHASPVINYWQRDENAVK